MPFFISVTISLFHFPLKKTWGGIEDHYQPQQAAVFVYSNI